MKTTRSFNVSRGKQIALGVMALVIIVGLALEIWYHHSPQFGPQHDQDATATAAALLNPDPSFHTLVIQDTLTSNSGPWDDGTNTAFSADPFQAGHCAFQEDGYHVITNGDLGFIPLCLMRDQPFSDFLVMVQMKLLSGSCGGFAFRVGEGEYPKLYEADVCVNGAFSLYYEQNEEKPEQLFSGTTPAIHPGLHVLNTIALAVRGSHFDLFVNKEHITRMQDQAHMLKSGNIGLIAYGLTSSMIDVGPAEAVFTHFFVWT